MRQLGHRTDSVNWMGLTISHQCLIESISSGAESLTGYSARELVGQRLDVLLAQRSAAEMPQILDCVREHGSWEGPVFYLTRQGEALEARATLSSLRDAVGGESGLLLVSFFCDSAHANGTAPSYAVGAQLRALAHEMNNPLAIMMGFAQLVMLDVQCSGRIRTDMEKVYAEMNRVAHVVEKLHAYAVALQKQEPESNSRKVGEVVAGG